MPTSTLYVEYDFNGHLSHLHQIYPSTGCLCTHPALTRHKYTCACMYLMHLPEETRRTKSSGSIRTYDHPPLILLLLLRHLAKLSKIKTANGTECLFVDHSGDAVDSPSPVPAPIHSALKHTVYTHSGQFSFSCLGVCRHIGNGHFPL